jgi:hypothetical protein
MAFGQCCICRLSSCPNADEAPKLANPIGLGRVTNASIWAYDHPRPGAAQLKSLARNTVVEIYATTSTEGLLPHNPVWYQTAFGWVYSSSGCLYGRQS